MQKKGDTFAIGPSSAGSDRRIPSPDWLTADRFDAILDADEERSPTTLVEHHSGRSPQEVKYEELAAAYRDRIPNTTLGWRECLTITAAAAISTQLETIAAHLATIATQLSKKEPDPPPSRPPVQASVYPARKTAGNEEVTDQSSPTTGTTFTRPKPRGPVVMPRLLSLDAG